MHGEMLLVASPLATISQRCVLSNLSELHDFVGAQLRIKSENKRKNPQTKHSQPTSNSSHKFGNSVVQVYRGKHGIGVYYVLIEDPAIVNQCCSLIVSSSKTAQSINGSNTPLSSQQSISKSRKNSSSGKLHKKGTELSTSKSFSYFAHNVTAAILCTGINGLSYSYASSNLLHNMPNRLHESVLKLTRLDKKCSDLDEMKRSAKSLLASLLFEEEHLYSNDQVGITFNSTTTSTYSVQNQTSLRKSIVNATKIEMEKMQILSISDKDMNLKADHTINRSKPHNREDQVLNSKSSQRLPNLHNFDYVSSISGEEDPQENKKTDPSLLLSKKTKPLKRPISLSMPRTYSKGSAFDKRKSSLVALQRMRTEKKRNEGKSSSTNSSDFVLRDQTSNNSTNIQNERKNSNLKKEGNDSDWTANFNSINLNSTDSLSPTKDFSSNFSSSNGRFQESDITSRDQHRLSSKPMHDEDHETALPQNDYNLNNVGGVSTISKASVGKGDDELSTSTVDTATPSEGPVPSLLLNIALSEDLFCSYESGKLITSSIEGTIQMQTKVETFPPKSIVLALRDPSRHLSYMKVMSNQVKDMTKESDQHLAETGIQYRFDVYDLDNSDEYNTILRYKCSNDLRPVPIRVQSRTGSDGISCRVALQISSNPANEGNLSDLSILMLVPRNVKGETLETSPAGGIWNPSKRSVQWRVAELGNGEKFQLQSQFEMYSREECHALGLDTSSPSFPVLVRCQCMHAQLSEIELEALESSINFPAEISVNLNRRFRLSHREKP